MIIIFNSLAKSLTLAEADLDPQKHIRLRSLWKQLSIDAKNVFITLVAINSFG